MRKNNGKAIFLVVSLPKIKRLIPKKDKTSER